MGLRPHRGVVVRSVTAVEVFGLRRLRAARALGLFRREKKTGKPYISACPVRPSRCIGIILVGARVVGERVRWSLIEGLPNVASKT